MSWASVGVDIVLHCCSAYRAMNAAALATYQAIRRDGTQKNVLASMQTREELYRYLDYHAYEEKLDRLFAAGKVESLKSGSTGCAHEPSCHRSQTEEICRPVGCRRR